MNPQSNPSLSFTPGPFRSVEGMQINGIPNSWSTPSDNLGAIWKDLPSLHSTGAPIASTVFPGFLRSSIFDSTFSSSYLSGFVSYLEPADGGKEDKKKTEYVWLCCGCKRTWNSYRYQSHCSDPNCGHQRSTCCTIEALPNRK
ncbi:uncharacterized protein EI97DRAFT_439970 [Westerdykella ornata]|uniref:Uncharacterized protein n=1 Tax=Westerdykella ornata TaxID=318751 RepID=A0A6A6JTT7_WESOR|nr:uncharacterized protein EI97DRAFT_439970 [Westerdykella ornata]KAF2279654.1 hypothetical protein EI97DRAFT_439970 [Westerdykella ornata]